MHNVIYCITEELSIECKLYREYDDKHHMGCSNNLYLFLLAVVAGDCSAAPTVVDIIAN